MKSKMKVLNIGLLGSAFYLLSACGLSGSRAGDAIETDDAHSTSLAPVAKLYSSSSAGKVVLFLTTGDAQNLSQLEQMGTMTDEMQKTNYSLTQNDVPTAVVEPIPNQDSFPVYFAGKSDDGIHLIALISNEAASRLKSKTFSSAPVTYQTKYQTVCLHFTTQNYTGMTGDDPGFDDFTFACDFNTQICVSSLSAKIPTLPPIPESNLTNDPHHYRCDQSKSDFASSETDYNTVTVSKINVSIDPNHRSFTLSDDVPEIAGMSAKTSETFALPENVLEFGY
jgi:hypothetical protein